MRANLDGNAAHVTMTIAPGHGAQMVYRGANGYASSRIGATVACTAPYWGRLTRVGAEFTGFISPDGVTWRAMGSVILNLPAAKDRPAWLASQSSIRFNMRSQMPRKSSTGEHVGEGIWLCDQKMAGECL